jgi:benzoate membrane transport protein
MAPDRAETTRPGSRGVAGRMSLMELPQQGLPGWRHALAALDRHAVSNGITAMVLACTGPLAILLSIGVAVKASPQDISTWIFGGYAFGGILSIIFSVLYRMPMGMCWTIPGVVLFGNALQHLPFAEVIGALHVTAAFLFVLGLSGWVRRITNFIPLNIVMAMVAGVFLPFCLKIVSGFDQDWLIAIASVGAYLVFWRVPVLERSIPPILPALAAGVAVSVATGQFNLSEPLKFAIADPLVYTPAFSWAATVELVLPMAITVVGIHNAQGFAISRDNGYDPPINTLTTACGVASVAFGTFGAVSACVTGPVNGILNTSGDPARRYMGGVVFGILILIFGILAPSAAQLALALPAAFIALLGGLGMFPVLRAAFVSAFSGRFQVGALVAFIVTVAGLPVATIGAPFWGIVFGTIASLLFERDDFRWASGDTTAA